MSLRMLASVSRRTPATLAPAAFRPASFATCTVPRRSDKPTVSPDPWPLPFSPSHVASTTPTSPDDMDLYLPPLDRSHETDLEITKKRLVYQARKRGMLEGDLLLATFARDNLGSMDRAQVDEFDRLMDENDWDIFYWAVNRKEPPARWANSSLLEQLRVHTRNEGKVVRFMPDLASAK